MDERVIEAVIEALKRFKDLGPWTGTVEQRKKKFRFFHEEMEKIFGISCKLVFQVPDKVSQWYSSGNSCVLIGETGVMVMVLVGRLAVLTILHEWGEIIFRNHEKAREWSQMLFKQVFPEQFSRLVRRGGLLVVK